MNGNPDAIAPPPATAMRGGLLELPQAEAWRWLAAAPDDEIPLVWAALVLARDEYPELDLPRYAAEMAELARPLEAGTDRDPLDTVRAINRVLYDERGFTGNQSDFYDPRNSYLNEVIDRRLGIPITLALLQMDLANRVGLPLKGVSFPGHFLVSLPLDEGVLVLDPFHRGRSIGLDELKARAQPHMADGELEEDQISELLSPASNRAILARMLRNLKTLYTEREDYARALRCADRLLLLEPDQPTELRDRGLLYLELGHYAGALRDLGRYLEGSPVPSDAEKIRRLLLKAGRGAARLN
jgi:regulator of sirC expression with transglutaminase-like and TPR domain